MTLGEKELELTVTMATLSHNHIPQAVNKAPPASSSVRRLFASVHQTPRMSDTQGQQQGGGQSGCPGRAEKPALTPLTPSSGRPESLIRCETAKGGRLCDGVTGEEAQQTDHPSGRERESDINMWKNPSLDGSSFRSVAGEQEGRKARKSISNQPPN